MAFGDTYNVDQNGNPINDAAKDAEQQARIASITSAINAGQPLSPGDRRLAEQHFGVGKLARMGSGITTIDGEQQADRPYWAILNPNSRSWEPFTVQVPNAAPASAASRPIPSPRPTPTPVPTPTPPSSAEIAAGNAEVKDAHTWVNQYLDSPKFRERMERTVSAEGLDPRNAANYGNIIRSRVQATQPEYVAQARDDGSWLFPDPNAVTQSRYDDNSNTAYTYGPQAKELGMSAGTIGAHEVGHAVGSVFTVPPQQQQTMRTALLPGMDEASTRSLPEQARADLYGIRYLADKLGVYNAKTEDFTEAHLTALENAIQQRRGEDGTILRYMLEAYGRDGLIKLMNLVAREGGSSIPNNAA